VLVKLSPSKKLNLPDKFNIHVQMCQGALVSHFLVADISFIVLTQNRKKVDQLTINAGTKRC